jgi:hypothetical protein
MIVNTFYQELETLVESHLREALSFEEKMAELREQYMVFKTGYANIREFYKNVSPLNPDYDELFSSFMNHRNNFTDLVSTLVGGYSGFNS